MAVAATRPAPASAWSRKCGRIRRTARIFRKRYCGPAKSIARPRSTGSEVRPVGPTLPLATERLSQRLEWRQRAAHLHHCGGNAVRRLGRFDRSEAGEACGKIGPIEESPAPVVSTGEGIWTASTTRGRRRSRPAPAPHRYSRPPRRRRPGHAHRCQPRTASPNSACSSGNVGNAMSTTRERFDDRGACRLGIRP